MLFIFGWREYVIDVGWLIALLVEAYSILSTILSVTKRREQLTTCLYYDFAQQFCFCSTECWPTKLDSANC